MGVPLQKRPHDLFVSYGHVDADRVAPVLDLLRSPTCAGLNVWVDEGRLRGGESVSSGIETGIQRSRALISLLSEESVASPWVEDEIQIADLERKDEPGFRSILIRTGAAELPRRYQTRKYLELPPEGPTATFSRELLTALLGAGAQGSAESDLYFSRPWRPDESGPADEIATALQERGYRLIGDTEDHPSFASRRDRIRATIGSCVGLVAVLPHRPTKPGKTSGYIVDEIALAVEAGVPAFVLSMPGVEARPTVEHGESWELPSDPVARASLITSLSYEVDEARLRSPPRAQYAFVAASLQSHRSHVRELRSMVEDVCGMPCYLGQDLRGQHAQAEIAERIRDAAVVVADVSDENRNSLIEAGIAIGAGTPLHLLSKPPEEGGLKTRFMFQDREVSWYSDGAEFVSAGFRLVRPYRRRIYAPV